MAERIDLGPQFKGDDEFTRRMRLHQSWYRAKVLGAGYGTGPRASSDTPYGNMLDAEAADAGLNFLTPQIFEVYQRRAGEGVEPFRCTRNMLSSQPMCFNLFGPLVDDAELATRLLRTTLGDDVIAVTDARIEYAPGPASEYSDDGTSFDAFFEYTAPDGEKAFLGVETKLTDSFSPEEYDKPRYQELTAADGSPWRPESWGSLKGTRTNQLWRNHLLVEATVRHPAAPHGNRGRFGVVYHPMDEKAISAIDEYRSYLADPANSFVALPLDELISSWRSAVTPGAEQEWLDAFEARYLNLSLSEGAEA